MLRMPWLGKTVLAASMIVGLIACGQTPEKRDLYSPYYQVPVKSLLVLHQAVEIPPGRTRIHLQRGEVGIKFDPYHPNCSLEVSNVFPNRSQVVRPGTFTVVRSQSMREEVVGLPRPVMLATANFTLADMEDGGGGFVHEGYHFWLENPDQPAVRRLTCRGVFDHPTLARPPSIAEIREALGAIASLQLK